MATQPETVVTDVLVVGSGGAGTRAALEARMAGAKTVLAVKGRFESVGVRGAGATAVGLSEEGAFFYFDPENGYPLIDPKEWGPISLEDLLDLDYQVIIQVGLGMADPKVARVLMQDIMSQRQQLEEWGVKIYGDRLRGHGVPLVAALRPLAIESGVDVREETAITDLLMDGGRCVGAVGVDFQGNPLVIQAGAVILCTGGDAALYLHNFHPPCVTGDGYAMAYQAGATLMNMEFGQLFISPLPAVTHPSAVWLFQPGAKLKNGLGEEFLAGYLPPGLTTEEVFAARTYQPMFTSSNVGKWADIAMVKETMAGRTGPYGGVFMDMTGPDITSRSIYNQDFLAQRGVRPSQWPMEIVVARHCSHGGPRIDEQGRTDIPGLYAGGGEAGSGPHGADRMGGHMLGCGQVFGARAGRDAARFARESATGSLSASVVDQGLERVRSLDSLRGQVRPAAAKLELQKRVWEDLNAVRTEAGCNRVLETVSRIRQETIPQLHLKEPADRMEAMDLLNMLVVAEMSAKAIAMRTESRGGHYREEYPEQNDAEWLKVITVRQENGRMALDTLAIDPSWTDRSDLLKRVSFAGSRK